MASQSKFLKSRIQRFRPSFSGESLRGWLTDLGIVGYKPKPWTTRMWDTAYEDGQLIYFAGLSERPRYSVLIGYLEYLEYSQEKLDRILDIGCGDGLLFSRAINIEYTSWTGIDLSRIAIAEADARASRQNSSSANFYCGDLLNTNKIPLDSHYDVIIINEVLNMSVNPQKMLQLCKEALRSDGHVLVSAWRHRGDRRIWEMIDKNFHTIDAVTIKPENNRLAPRGWKIALLKAKLT